MILCIETATNICSVALCDKENIVGIRESDIDKSHASLLTIFIEELLKEHGLNAELLDAVAISKGPGSYTGLRIAASTAKGICYGAGIPLIAINTLESMYFGAIKKFSNDRDIPENSLFCPMIDARRMEVYSALFDPDGKEVQDVRAEIISEESYSDYLKNSAILFFGNGSDKCIELINNSNAIFKKGYNLSAASLAEPAYNAFTNKRFEDIAYFEPYYLKDFVATIPRKNILG